MSDLDDAISALGGKPTPSLGVVPAAERQAVRDRQAALLDRAIAEEPGNADLRRERDASGRVAAPSAPQAQAALPDDLQGAIDALSAKSPISAAPPQRDDETAGVKGSDLFSPGGALRVAGSMVAAPGAALLGGWRGIATLASGGSLEEAARAVDDTTRSVAFEPRNAGDRAVARGLASGANPLNWIGMAGNYLGEGATDLATKAGATPELAGGIGSAVNTTINAIPFVLGGSESLNKPIEFGTREAVTAPAAELAGPTPSLEVPTFMRRRAAAMAKEPTLGEVAQGAAPKTAEVVPITKALPAAAAPAPALTAPAARAAAAERAAVLKRIGLTEPEMRTSAVYADPKAASTEFQMGAKVEGEVGAFMKGVLDKEREALTNHAEDIVQGTGGTLGLDQKALTARGTTILAPLDGLKAWFDDKIGTLYKAADERAKGTPTALPSFADTLNDSSMLTNSDRVHLQGATQAYLKKLGVLDKDGNFSGATVQQAETIRKYLGENWSPQNSRFVGALKDALDNDVTQAAGEDIYSQARAVRRMRAVTLDDPKGISKLLDASGPQGINRAVPIERIPDSVASMPVDQLQHVVRTLDNMPPELQAQARAAKAEIKAHFANELLEAGNKNATQWNAKNVRAYLDANASKIGMLFTPEEIAKLNDLREAGNILHKDASYPGAAAQQHNLVRSGMTGAARGIGAAAGAATGALFGAPSIGAFFGDWLGNAAASKAGEAAGLRAAKGRMVKLGEFAR